MAKEDKLLREEMERLEIEPITLNRSKSDENPFMKNTKRSLLIRTSVQNSSCCCDPIKKNINNGICKRKHNKILKAPALQFLTGIGHKIDSREESQQEPSAIPNINRESLSLCTLVKTCNQLKISNGLKDQPKSKDGNDKTKWWKNEVKISSRNSREQGQSNQAGSCSQQALNPQCDITIDELASYFETLVHIPKKMSSMAEMMYI